MSNTKIVLNRQSDLILDNAQITNPEGIVKPIFLSWLQIYQT